MTLRPCPGLAGRDHRRVGRSRIRVRRAVREVGLPTLAEFRAAIDRPGYFELAGAGLGVAAVYPYVGFRDTVVPGGVLDVYVHLLGYCLSFIVVFVFLLVADEI